MSRSEMVFCIESVKDLVDANITAVPVGNTIRVFGKQSLCLYPPKENSNLFLSALDDVRGINNFLDGVKDWDTEEIEGGFIHTLPQAIIDQRVELDDGDERMGKWSISSVCLAHNVFGLCDDHEFRGYGGELWVIQGPTKIIETIGKKLLPYTNENETYVARKITGEEMDNYLREGKVLPIFQTLSEIRRRFEALKYEGVIKHLSEAIGREQFATFIEEAAEETDFRGGEEGLARFTKAVDRRLERK